MISDSIALPRDAGTDQIAAHRAARLTGLVEALLCFVLSVIIAVLWLADRSRHDLLWLALYLVLIAAGRFDAFQQIAAHAEPWAYGNGRVRILYGLLPAVVMGQLTASIFGLRWVSWLIWPLLLLFPFAAGIDTQSLTWCIQGVTLAAFLQAIFRPQRNGPLVWGGAVRWILLSSLVTLFWFHADSYAGWRPYFPVPVINIGAFGRATHSSWAVVFSLAFAIYNINSILRDRLRLSTEFEAASALQKILLSDTTRQVAGYSIHAVYRPAAEVGGDFYQISEVTPDGAVLVAIGDVSGKGLKAAMAVSMLCGGFRSRHSDQPAAILAECNRAVLGALDGGFVTAAIFRCEADGRVRYASAGHPLLQPVDAGLPLGVLADAEWVESELVTGTITLVSDGVIEAATEKGELLGFDRTRDMARQPAHAIADAAQKWGQNDDITVVTITRSAAV